MIELNPDEVIKDLKKFCEKLNALILQTTDVRSSPQVFKILLIKKIAEMYVIQYKKDMGTIAYDNAEKIVGKFLKSFAKIKTITDEKEIKKFIKEKGY